MARILRADKPCIIVGHQKGHSKNQIEASPSKDSNMALSVRCFLKFANFSLDFSSGGGMKTVPVSGCLFPIFPAGGKVAISPVKTLLKPY
jgi:hypothetical protein